MQIQAMQNALAQQNSLASQLSGVTTPYIGGGGGGGGYGATTTIANTFPSTPWQIYQEPAWAHAIVMETMGLFRVTKITNGYLVHYAKSEGDRLQTHFASNFEEAGKIMVAMLVKFQLEKEK